MLWNVFDREFLLPSLLLERTPSPFATPRGERLPLTLTESEHGLHLEAEVPGFTAEELNLELEGRRLVLTAEKNTAGDDGGPSERVSLRRELRLPFAVERDGLSAKLEHGVLTVDLPRAAAERPVSIPVSSN